MSEFMKTALITFFACFVLVPIIFGFIRLFGLYAIVQERTCRVYVLFGTVVGILDEPGFYILPFKLGLSAFVINWLGKCHVVDMRLDQQYLRSEPVNSEEGAPMGIGIWYEMFIDDPLAFLFKNADPRGSLRSNVSNASVRCLSNMKLTDMLETRHRMSQTVRADVSEKSVEWGYKLGSVYIRKVHFRDVGMIQQIEAKVVNRLRQVTSAIRQDGANTVSVITSTAERQAAAEFARATAMRPQIVGAGLKEITRDPEIADALFEILEIQKILEGESRLTLVPPNKETLNALMAAQGAFAGAPAGQVAGQATPPPVTGV